eukprot:INCI15865.2.p1 GENE.INCI15865.2~~INCI15865.2.p1  ORF type:complete len:1123 (+),score=241.14 INCI15865.2:118-3486(+)
MMFRRLGRVLEKEKERLKENLKKVGGVNNAEETRKKKEALDQLRASYKALLQDHLGATDSTASALNESSAVVNDLCTALETCLFHGVKKSRRANELPHFWQVVEGLADINEQAFGPTLFMVRQLPTVQTPYGLCRAWIRKILNENSLAFNLQTMRKHPKLLVQAYEPVALLRDAEASEILVTILQSLDGFAFRIELSQLRLDAEPSKPVAVRQDAGFHSARHQAQTQRSTQALVVRGAGMSNSNGRYSRKGDKDGAAWFVSDKGFEIFRFASGRAADGQPTWQWCLGQPTASALYYYQILKRPDALLPPESGWVVHSSTNQAPAPSIEFELVPVAQSQGNSGAKPPMSIASTAKPATPSRSGVPSSVTTSSGASGGADTQRGPSPTTSSGSTSRPQSTRALSSQGGHSPPFAHEGQGALAAMPEEGGFFSVATEDVAHVVAKPKHRKKKKKIALVYKTPEPPSGNDGANGGEGGGAAGGTAAAPGTATTDGAPSLDFQVTTHVFKTVSSSRKSKKKKHKHHHHHHKHKHKDADAGGEEESSSSSSSTTNRRSSRDHGHRRRSRTTPPKSSAEISSADAAETVGEASPEIGKPNSVSLAPTAAAGGSGETLGSATVTGVSNTGTSLNMGGDGSTAPDADAGKEAKDGDGSESDFDDDQFIAMIKETAGAAGIDKGLTDDEDEDDNDDDGAQAEAELLRSAEDEISPTSTAVKVDDHEQRAVRVRPSTTGASITDQAQPPVGADGIGAKENAAGASAAAVSANDPAGENEESPEEKRKRVWNTFSKSLRDIAELKLAPVRVNNNWEMRVEHQRKQRLRAQFVEKRKRLGQRISQLRSELGPRASEVMMHAYGGEQPADQSQIDDTSDVKVQSDQAAFDQFLEQRRLLRERILEEKKALQNIAASNEANAKASATTKAEKKATEAKVLLALNHVYVKAVSIPGDGNDQDDEEDSDDDVGSALHAGGGRGSAATADWLFRLEARFVQPGTKKDDGQLLWTAVRSNHEIAAFLAWAEEVGARLTPSAVLAAREAAAGRPRAITAAVLTEQVNEALKSALVSASPATVKFLAAMHHEMETAQAAAAAAEQGGARKRSVTIGSRSRTERTTKNRAPAKSLLGRLFGGGR